MKSLNVLCRSLRRQIRQFFTKFFPQFFLFFQNLSYWIRIRVGSVISKQAGFGPGFSEYESETRNQPVQNPVVTKENLTFDSIQLMTLPLSAIGTSSFTSGVLSYPRLLSTCSSLNKDKPLVSDPHWF